MRKKTSKVMLNPNLRELSRISPTKSSMKHKIPTKLIDSSKRRLTVQFLMMGKMLLLMEIGL